MSIVRKIDYAEAKRRYEEGETIASIARRFGVTPTAIRRVVLPGFRERMLVSARKSQRLLRLRGRACPSCGDRMAEDSKLCRECSNAARLGEIETAVPKPGVLDYFSSGRYGLLAVSGIGSWSDEPGTTFSIVDTLDMCVEVDRVRVRAPRVAAKREELVAKVKEMNRGALSRRTMGARPEGGQ